MAFGMFSQDPNDSYKTGEALRSISHKDAKDRVNAFLGTAMVGGTGVDTIGQMRYKEIMDDVGQYANQKGQQADLFGKVASFAKGVGSFGADGGFGNFGGGTDTLGVSDLQSFGRSPADIRTLESGGFIDHGYIG